MTCTSLSSRQAFTEKTPAASAPCPAPDGTVAPVRTRTLTSGFPQVSSRALQFQSSPASPGMKTLMDDVGTKEANTAHRGRVQQSSHSEVSSHAGRDKKQMKFDHIPHVMQENVHKVPEVIPQERLQHSTVDVDHEIPTPTMQVEITRMPNHMRDLRRVSFGEIKTSAMHPQSDKSGEPYPHMMCGQNGHQLQAQTSAKAMQSHMTPLRKWSFGCSPDGQHTSASATKDGRVQQSSRNDVSSHAGKDKKQIEDLDLFSTDLDELDQVEVSTDSGSDSHGLHLNKGELRQLRFVRDRLVRSHADDRQMIVDGFVCSDLGHDIVSVMLPDVAEQACQGQMEWTVLRDCIDSILSR